MLSRRPHWLQVLPGVEFAVCLAAVVAGFVVPWVYGFSAGTQVLTWLCVGLVALPLAISGMVSFLQWRNTRYAVTDRRLIVRYGVLRRYNRDTPLHRVQDVHLDQGVLARIARAGDLTVESAGAASAIEMRWMPDPESTRRIVHELARESRRREPDPDRDPELDADL